MTRPLVCFGVVEVPAGKVLLVATGGMLSRVVLDPSPSVVASLEGLCHGEVPLAAKRGCALLAKVSGMVREYFSGRRVSFAGLPLDLSCGTEFQRRVWNVTSTIPYGEVRTYKWIAIQLGGVNLARAVGQALARNPMPVVIPCHRVIEESGCWGGFSAGHRWKAVLLELEGGEQKLTLRERRIRIRGSG